MRCLFGDNASKVIFGLVCVVSLFSSNVTQIVAAAPSMEGWEALSSQQNVSVFRRQISNSDIIAVRGITTLPFPVEEVYAVLSDSGRSHEWMPLATKKETVRQIDSKSRIEYTLLNMPWPLADRYTVARGELDIQPGRVYAISYVSVDGEHLEPGRIRVELEMSSFYFRPAQDNHTYIDIALLSDPMGAIPKFLVNSFQQNWPVQFLVGLKNQINKVRAELPNVSSPRDAEKMVH